MIVSHINDLQSIEIQGPDILGASKKVLVSPIEGWESHVMRVFELVAGGHTPRHTHAWPHINYITKGKGLLHLDGKDYEVSEGSYAYVPGGIIHQFSNPGDEPFAFMCIIPEEGDK